MPKIMIIHHAASIGGGSISFIDVINMLKPKYDVVICCPDNPPDLKKLLESKELVANPSEYPIPEYNHYNGAPSMFTRTFWKGIFNLKYYKEWILFIQRFKPDVVIVNSSVMCLLGPAIRKAGSKAVCFVRETWNGNSIKSSIMKRIINRYFHGALFISKFDMINTKIKVSEMEVINDCISHNFLKVEKRDLACQRININPSSFNLLYTGGGSWIKGLDILLESLTYLKEENINIIIAGNIQKNNGDNGLKDRIKAVLNIKQYLFSKKVKDLLDQSSISNKVHILGSQTDMSYCYSACDVVVFPSSIPHQSRPLYEAGQYALPIIITDYENTKEFAVNNFNALTFNPGDSKDLARAIDELYYNRTKLNYMGNQNQIKTKELHSFDIEKDKLLKFMEQII